MAEVQVEPFRAALAHLRDRLRNGTLAPGARIMAVDLADELRLSTTPVREALSRLAGEGLVEDRRGQGYFVRAPSAADIADFYRMSLAHLLIALEPRRTRRLATPAAAGPRTASVSDPVESVEQLFQAWVAATGSRALVRSFDGLQIQLGPVRRLEGAILPDLANEAARLLALEPEAARADRLGPLRQFHGRRIRDAGRLGALVEAVATHPRK